MSAICINCGTEDPDPDHRVPCSNCGDMRRTFSRQIVEPNIQVTDSISVLPTFHLIRKFYKENPKLKGLHIAYCLGGAVVGYLISSFDSAIGFTIGTVTGLMCVVNPPYTKNTEYSLLSPDL